MGVSVLEDSAEPDEIECAEGLFGKVRFKDDEVGRLGSGINEDAEECSERMLPVRAADCMEGSEPTDDREGESLPISEEEYEEGDDDATGTDFGDKCP